MAAALPGATPSRNTAEGLEDLEPESAADGAGLDAWVVHFCTHHGLNGQPRLKGDEDGFREKCKMLFHQELQHCIQAAALTKVDMFKTGKQWGQLLEQAAACKAFNKEVETSQAAVAVSSNVAKAVAACDDELLGVCMTHCRNKAKAELQEDADCLEKCSTMKAFHTGTIVEGKDGGADWIQSAALSLAADGRDPALEAMMREMTVKCVCVSLPSPAERCYADEGSGLRPGQKWCEWRDTPSWRPVMEKWSKHFKEEMPVPKCNEFPIKG